MNSTKLYAITDPRTGLYSTYKKTWEIIAFAQVWDNLGDVKNYIEYNNQLAIFRGDVKQYTSPMEIVEIERQYRNKGLVEKI